MDYGQLSMVADKFQWVFSEPVWSKYSNRLSPGYVIRDPRIFYTLGRLIRSN
jgi:hypothetical protein